MVRLALEESKQLERGGRREPQQGPQGDGLHLQGFRLPRHSHPEWLRRHAEECPPEFEETADGRRLVFCSLFFPAAAYLGLISRVSPHFLCSFSKECFAGPSPRTASEPAPRRLSLKKEKASTEPLSQGGSTFKILSIAKKWESFDAADDDEETELSASCQTLVLSQ